jgi:SAM-dependent methyltransferase
MNAEYWTKFYSKVDDRLNNCSDFCNFAILYLKENVPDAKTVFDMGCGNGRDLRYFKSKGYDARGIDASQECAKTTPDVKCGDIVTYMFEHVDVYYSRFSLHSLPYSSIPVFLKNIATSMTTSSVFFIETRSIQGTEHSNIPYKECEFASPIGGVHKRTLVSLDHLTKMVTDIGFTVILSIESSGLAVFADADPVIIRMILKK